MCTNNYSNKERFDKVITKIKWCSFFVSQCRLAIARMSLDCNHLIVRRVHFNVTTYDSITNNSVY